jgi:hypothetical protein
MPFQGQAFGAQTVINPLVAVRQEFSEMPIAYGAFNPVSSIKYADKPAKNIAEPC